MPRGGRTSKLKGAEYERSICRRFSMWIAKRKDVFWRSAMSGGRSTIADKGRRHGKAEHHAGDLVATHPAGAEFIHVFAVECKHVESLFWHRAIHRTSRTSRSVRQFWKQAVDETPEGREPMLVAKDPSGEIVAVTQEGLDLLRLGVSRWTDFEWKCVFRWPGLPDALVFRLVDVLTHVDGDRLVRALRKKRKRGTRKHSSNTR